jgi:hypothetical protein
MLLQQRSTEMERDEIMNLSLSENSSDPKNAGCKLIKLSFNVLELLNKEAPTERRHTTARCQLEYVLFSTHVPFFCVFPL